MPRKRTNERINTVPALKALISYFNGNYHEAARELGASHSALHHACKGNRPPVTLDTLVDYATSALKHGVHMSLSVDPGGDLSFSVYQKGAPSWRCRGKPKSPSGNAPGDTGSVD